MENKPVQPVFLGGFLANKLPKILLGVSLIGFLLSLVFIKGNTHHYLLSYLFSFSFFMTLTLGAVFFVLIQMVSRAGWSVVVRRVPEVLMTSFPLMILLALPILIGAKEIYHWAYSHDVTDHILVGKQPYLNLPFFYIRAVIFFGIWLFISRTFFKNSVEQDSDGDENRTLKLQRFSTFSIILFALTLTFAFIDWVMSLTPHWYSTIFGVYFFAGSILVALVVTSLLYMLLRRSGYLSSIVSVEHFHDLGKLIYGFNIFWTYIAFSQFFLIWYANLPEETAWYHMHFEGSWANVATLLVIGHFVIPFFFFMSRHAKRDLRTHCIMAVWLLIMHIVDLYWIIMPNASPNGIHITYLDVLLFVSMGSGYFAYFFYRLKKQSLLPVKDPRIEESLNFHNV